MATFPSSSIPRLLNLVPALRHDNRDIKVSEDGSPVLVVRRGADDEGMVIVRTNPRMADVSIRELSNASLSCGRSRDLNFTRGLIMYEFQRKESSRLSISKVEESVDLQDVNCERQGRFSDFRPVLQPVRNIEIRAVVETPITQQLLKFDTWML